MKLVSTRRLNYMQAFIKEYDDGTEILQSYDTDVVMRTPKGEYIRLWDGWSNSTMKQVKAWCGLYFRGLPFRNGTHEDLRPESKRIGYNLNGGRQTASIDHFAVSKIRDLKRSVSAKDISSLLWQYNTACTKEIKHTFKDDKRILRLFAAMRICALRKSSAYDNKGIEEESKYKELAMAARLYDYDFKTLWNSCLKDEYSDFDQLKN